MAPEKPLETIEWGDNLEAGRDVVRTWLDAIGLTGATDLSEPR